MKPDKECWKLIIKEIAQIYFIRAHPTLKYQSNDCNQLQLGFITNLLEQKQVDDT